MEMARCRYGRFLDSNDELRWSVPTYDPTQNRARLCVVEDISRELRNRNVPMRVMKGSTNE